MYEKTKIKINSPEIRIIFKSFIPLFLALLFQQLLSIFVNLLDNFMLGNYMESAMSGATIVNQIQGVVSNLVFGIGSGVTILGAQYWGKREIKPIKCIFADGLKTAFVVGIVFTVLTLLFPSQILSILTNDPEILDQAGQYLSIMCWTYLIYSLSAVLMFSLQSVESAFVGTIMSASTILINFCLNYLLIYGNFGFPELGIRGAAYATLTSRIVELFIVVIYLLFIDKKIHIKIAELVKFKTGYYKDYIKTAAPIIITGAMWGFGLAAQTAIIGHLTTAAIGASSIAVTVSQLFLVPEFAACNACGVTMGKTVGSNKMDVVKPLARVFQLFLLCLGLLMGLLLFVLRGTIIRFYSVDAETARLAFQFMTILSITCVGSTYEYPVMGGIIAGGGDTKYQTIIDMTFMWLLVIPCAAVSAFVFEWPTVVTFIFLKFDQILKCIPNSIYCNSFKWIKNRTR